ncbi:Cysteine-rich receptor-like protein kinase [Sesamum alatum]|uniref:Cysteine-rich receptor-like protein kinase n=1 Tax=Sesamum alatum TaxID=300844 RepID=A0AAE1YNN2_9LAMI|nr:Cysteine-rich receptor-like protein kinase [Sesamum alatum]
MSSSRIIVGGPDDEERFLRQLKEADPRQYLFQLEMFPKLYPGHSPKTLRVFASDFEKFGKLGFPITQAMDLGEVKHYSYSELEEITPINNRQSSDFITRTIPGRLLHGRIKMDSSSLEDVLVKTWDFDCNGGGDSFIYHLPRFHDELILLRDPDIKSHPNVVKLIGYHCEKSLAVIYKGKRPTHLLKEILKSDYFVWEDRMRVAIAIGSALKMFHDKGFLYGGYFSWSTMLDENFYPTIYGFQAYNWNKMFYRGFIGQGPMSPPWSLKDDVFAYGILLLELVSKGRCIGGAMFMPELWWNNKPPNSIVDEYFSVNQSVASKITELVFSCLDVISDEQPSTGAAVAALQNFASIPAMKKQKLCE